MKNYNTLFIANRGEIACRIIQTARRLGLKTVLGYSDPDRDTLGMQLADVTVRLGEGPVHASYLDQDKVIALALQHGAEALHPGYGLLSENSGFARKVRAAGLIWVGPSPDSMDQVASKSHAKAVAERAGVPTVPGHRGPQDLASFREAAAKIRYPVLLKATAGGGGRGIRLVEDENALEAQMELARGEALNAFGDGELLLEKYIPVAHHVEVQVFGDVHGQVIHMGERDCSAQRRNQKVIEESPSPALTRSLQEEIRLAAVRLAAEAGYSNAGTVEFLVTPDGTFYFLEMNTRLQVEHPVTEMVTGLDLVEWQLRVADGEPLPPQTSIKLRGHAMEARLYAEDPADGFRPQTGAVRGFIFPAVRVDHFLTPHTRITHYYDAMLAKIIVYGENRAEALRKLREALAQTLVAGLRTNGAFLDGILASKEFQDGKLYTRTLDHQAPSQAQPPSTGFLAALASMLTVGQDGWSNSAARQHLFRWRLGEKSLMANWSCDKVVVNGEDFHLPDEEVRNVPRLRDRYGVDFSWDHQWYRLDNALHEDTRTSQLLDPNVLASPMEGTLLKLLVAAGEMVSKGQIVAVVEAMKMQMEIRSTREGVVAEVSAQAGTQVKKHQTLVKLT